MTATAYPIPSHLPPIVLMELEQRRAWLADVPEADRAARWAEIVEDIKNVTDEIAFSEIPYQYRQASPEGARDAEAFAKVTRHPRCSDRERQGKRGMILFGDTGSGKSSAGYARVMLNLLNHHTMTHISAVRLARMVRESVQKSADFALMMRLLTRTETEADTEDGDQGFVGRWQSCCGLLLDDIHVPKLTPAFSAALYGIVEAQTAEGNELIVTSQLDALGLLRKWRADAPELADTARAVVRRIVDHCEPINFVWEDSPWA